MSKADKKPTMDEIAEMAARGEDVEEYLGGGEGKMKPPRTPENAPQRVNVDFMPKMLKELDDLSGELNISRQAVIKFLVRNGLDDHYLASAARRKKA
jgi:hypothetical protein